MYKFIGISLSTALIYGAFVNLVQAASICKGLDKTACEAEKIDDVPICRWQGEYFTTSGKRGNYCTTSNRKLNKEQFEKLQARLPQAN